MKLRGVIFDLDGTLGDTIPLLCEAFRLVFHRFLGRRYADGDIAALFGPSEEGIFQRMVPDRWEDCLQTYLALYEEMHGRLPGPFPGIEDVLKLLKERGVSLAVVTGKNPRTTAISLRDFRLSSYFHPVETGSPHGAEKPRMIRRVVRRWGLPRAQVAYVGDTAYDVEAAREAGIAALGAAWSPTSDYAGLERMNPLAVFRTVATFHAWIDRNVETALP